MEFFSDNIGWVVIGGIILFGILSSLLEDRGTKKITTTVKTRLASAPQSYRQPTKISSASRGYSPSDGLPRKEKIIDTKIKSGGTIHVRYTKQNGTISDRTLKPLYIRHENGSMYLRAYCYLRREKRTFRLSRMEILS